jgi:hypothetical protein
MCVSRYSVEIGGKVDWKFVLYCEVQPCDMMGTRERGEWDGKRPSSAHTCLSIQAANFPVTAGKSHAYRLLSIHRYHLISALLSEQLQQRVLGTRGEMKALIESVVGGFGVLLSLAKSNLEVSHMECRITPPVT